MVLFVCEVEGNDISGDGTSQQPFKTAIRALEHCEDGSIQCRKSLVGESSGFQEISGAALKKARKGLDVNRKKSVKEEERKLRDLQLSSEREATEQQKLENAKNIILSRDPSWTTPSSVDTPSFISFTV